jgi:hypothetical protein
MLFSNKSIYINLIEIKKDNVVQNNIGASVIASESNVAEEQQEGSSYSLIIHYHCKSNLLCFHRFKKGLYC